MLIEYDQAKDVANRARHGVSLERARTLDWDMARVWIDDRYDYDEIRMCGLVPEEAVLYFVAFVDRGDLRRIISLRRATRKEVSSYVENY